MMIKICGMREPANIVEAARLAPDFMGFIFYERSPRHAGAMPPEALEALPAGIRRVGVFVDADPQLICETAQRYRLDFAQLHGAESPETCALLRDCGLGVIKAFGVASRDDTARTAAYEGVCNYYIFDTAGPSHGGTGRKFDHSMLTAYEGCTPYLLSGGIGPEDTDLPRDERCAGLDINSRFETAPGIKNTEAIKKFMQIIKKPRT